MTRRLSEAALGALSRDVRRPSYDRKALSPGVVHLGLGAFHRAHQAPIFDRLIDAGDRRWGVVGASLRSPQVRDTLLPQDGLFSLFVEESEHRSAIVIGTTLDVIFAPGQPRRLIEAIASGTTQLVTISVTEKGYKLDPASGLLLEDDPDVRRDMASLDAPLTIAGYLAAGLKLRKHRGLPPITIASCDNMTDNGGKLLRAVVRIAKAHDQALADWIAQHCAFPNAMVDRIVPATTRDDIARSADTLGLLDLATVRTEPFSLWVIEDRLIGAAAELERAGVQVARDLAPWERAKLRLLNGAHSAIAYLGGLCGIETVDAFVAKPWGERFVEMLWDEIEPTLAPAPGLDLRDYRIALMRRFANRALGHRLRQIALDGSHKLPQRLLGPALELIARGALPDCIALSIAAWMKWQSGRDDAGIRFAVEDPLASTTARLVAASANTAEKVRALLSIGSIFPPVLSDDPAFTAKIAGHLQSLERVGARATLERLVGEAVAP